MPRNHPGRVVATPAAAERLRPSHGPLLFTNPADAATLRAGWRHRVGMGMGNGLATIAIKLCGSCDEAMTGVFQEKTFRRLHADIIDTR